MKPTKIKTDEVHGDDFTHPAFGTVYVGRVSCGGEGEVLFQSAIKHQHYVTLSINRAQVNRNLNRDSVFERDKMIEVKMSEQQWATLVSSLNLGGGVPCTLDLAPVPGAEMERLPKIEVEPTKTTFENEMAEHLNQVVGRADDLVERLEAMLEPGKGIKKGDVQALHHDLKMLRMNVKSNTPFVQQQFARAMEKTTEAAKAEVDGFILRRLQSAGLEALLGEAEAEMPLLIEGDK